MRKKNNKFQKEDSIKFAIPQFENPYEGLKLTKDKYVEPKFASPIGGTHTVSNEIAFDDNLDEVGNLNKKYDSYRSLDQQKLTTKERNDNANFYQITEEDYESMFPGVLERNNKKVENKTMPKPFDNETSEVSNKINDTLDTDENKEEVKEEQCFGFDFEPLVHEEVETEPINKPSFSRNGEYSKQSSIIVRKPKQESVRDTFNTNVGLKENNIEEKVEFNNHQSESINVSNNDNFTNLEPVNNFNEINEEKVSEEINEPVYEEPKELIPALLNPYNDYKLPPLDLISCSSEDNNSDIASLEESKEIINQTLASFDINGCVEHYVEGPTFTRYEISLEIGTNVKKVTTIQDTLQMNLGVTSLRIQAPIPGKKTVGIEVPNRVRKAVAFGDILSEDYINDGKVLNVALGKDIDGNVICTNIAKWPHGLIAGSTGSGKSVSINTIIVSILLKAKPDEVKFLMIDPKVVELSVYNDIPHLITPVISDPKQSSKALDWAVNEMERRYNLFTTVKAREIVAYNEKAKEDPTLQRIPYIVIVIDEMADLMMQCGQEAEDSIKRLTAKARAAGIHLLCATQRPTVDVIKGTIKANIQTRIAFKVNSTTDSITILDEAGAESLLGRGDMLIKEVDMAKRVQGAYIKDEEIDAVVNFIQNEADANYLFTHDDLSDMGEENGTGPGANIEEESSSLLYNIAIWCCENQACSVNRIQQAFQLGFHRAQNIIKILQNYGIVSEMKGNKRDILMNLSQINDLFERTK